MSLQTPLNAAHQGSESSIDVTRGFVHFCGEGKDGRIRTGPRHLALAQGTPLPPPTYPDSQLASPATGLLPVPQRLQVWDFPLPSIYFLSIIQILAKCPFPKMALPDLRLVQLQVSEYEVPPLLDHMCAYLHRSNMT